MEIKQGDIFLFSGAILIVADPNFRVPRNGLFDYTDCLEVITFDSPLLFYIFKDVFLKNLELGVIIKIKDTDLVIRALYGL